MGKFAGAVNRAGKEARTARRFFGDFAGSATLANRSTTRLGSSVGRLVGVFGGLFVLRTIISTMASFERAMAEVATIAQGGAESVAQLREGILQLAGDIPQTPQELGAGAYQILSAGITDTSDALLVLEASSKAAVAGLTDTATSVDAVTTILNAFRLEADQATRVTDVLFETVRLGKLRFEDIATSIGAAATSASLAGVTLEELTAGMASMTLAGIDAQEATTSINRLFLTLVNQTDEQRKKFEELGIAFNVTTVAEKGFAGLLEEVNKLTDGQLDILAQLFPNIRAARSAFVLAGNALDRYKEILDALNQATGSADAAFATMTQTLENQFRLLTNQLNVAFQRLAVEVIPFLVARIQDLRIVFDTFFDSAGASARRAAREMGDFVRTAERLGMIDFGAEQIGREVLDIGQKLWEARQQLAALEGEPGRPVVFEAGLGATEIGKSSKAADELRGEIAELEDQLRGAHEAARQFNLKRIFRESRTEVDALIDSVNRQALALNRAKLESEERIALERQLRRAAIEDAQKLLETLQLEGAERKRLQTFIEQQKLAITGLAAAGEDTEENEKRRGKLQEELAKRVSEVTRTTAQQQLDTIARLRKEWAVAFQGISAEAEEQFAIVEEAARAALRAEQAEELAREFADRLRVGLRDIELETAGIQEEEARTAAVLQRQTELLRTLEAEYRGRLEAADLTAEEEEEVKNILAEIVKLLRQAKKEQLDVGEGADEAEKQLRALQHSLQLIRQSVDGTLELARAFGIVNDETAQTIRNLEQIGSGIAMLAVSIPTMNIPGIVAGGLGLIGGVAGLIGGGDAAEEARRRDLAENTQALKELSNKVHELTGTFDIAGSDFARALQAFQGIDFGGFDIGADIAQLLANFERLGISFEDLDALARELGITIRDDAGKLMFEGLMQLKGALEEIQDYFIGFPETIEGTLQRLRIEFEIFKVDDPIEQLRRIQDELAALTKIGEGVPALAELFQLDVTTAEGRRQAEALIRQLFEQLVAGIITPAALGAATFEEAVNILRQMAGLLDEISTEQSGQTQDVSRQVQITELQASQLLAFQATQTIYQERIDRNVARLAEGILSGTLPPLVAPPPIGAPATGGIPIAGGTTEIDITIEQIDINVGAGATPELAREVGLEAVDVIRRELGTAYADQLRAMGIRQ